MSAMFDIEDVVRWFHRERTPTVSGGQALELYFTFHPRTAFLKNLPTGARVADIGAGDGSMSVFRRWPAPERPDLRLYAYSLEKGEHFDAFEGFEVGDWNLMPPAFDGVPLDAVVSAHFIEHIAEPASLARWLGAKLRPGGRAYLEWPSQHALDMPPRHALAARGVELVISRFDDDRTHRNLPDRAELAAVLAAEGFEVEAEGVIRLPWVEEQLMATQRDADDRFPRQAAYWLMSGWSQYLVVCKPLPAHGDGPGASW